ncbi:MAG TPA: PP2C family protein-serine/threonine phosphatase, partial [Candidatus Ozemobacteraceae bacterium]|nr:PP2C family protein-serine/threonine phosphatase [Candidatus Ozemobacteraceae bacterium]
RRVLTQSYQSGVELVFAEAEALKVRVEQRAVELTTRSRAAYHTSMVFLIIVFVVGVIVLTVYPARVSGDLQRLSDQIGSYQIGTALDAAAPIHTRELRDLRGAFCELADRLTGQVGVIGRYTNAIEHMGDVFATLHRHSEEPGSGEQALRESVYRALEQLSVIEGLSLAKVMVRRRRGGEVVLSQLGDEYVAPDFVESGECREYLNKTPAEAKAALADVRDSMPYDEGISGWLMNYWDAPEGRVASFDGHRDLIANRDFLQRKMVIPVIGEQQQLAKRKFERGLMGAAFGVKIPWLADQAARRRRGGIKDPGPIEREFVPSDEGMIGILFLYFADRETRISEQERLFAQIIGGQIAQLIHAYLMLDQQKELQKLKYHLQMAAEIQEHLLPAKNRVPRHPHVQISVVCKPAGDVGGDYYDFPFPPFQIGGRADPPPDTIHVIIADASGKNIPAALLMTILKTAVASMDIGTMRPHEVLMTANQIINKCITSDRFITALYLILHTQTGIVEVASAGHCLPIHVSPKGAEPRIHQLKARSLMPLGIMEDTRYETDRFQLHPGDGLFLYTDGVIEARNSGPNPEEFGMERLKKFLLRDRPKDFAAALLAEIEQFRGDAAQHDDITAVLVEWSGGKS